MDSKVKKEVVVTEGRLLLPPSSSTRRPEPHTVIELSSSDSDSDEGEGSLGKRSRISDEGALKRRKGNRSVLPVGFLDPLPPFESTEQPPSMTEPISSTAAVVKGNRQFWKAGDYGDTVAEPSPSLGNMDHVRVHPKFLHSNATSHKWALGAFAELLDNSLDEACNGATYGNIDMLVNKKDGTRMLLIEDNGGGMDPDKMRQCMSLGYSAKSKIANTIGQYGNGFKTSTMRLGADVIVFSRSSKKGRSPTKSIGMLSYTFLKNTRKVDIVVPMLDYEKKGTRWNKMVRSSSIDWNVNLKTILQWSPYATEAELLRQFSSMNGQGTRIVIYNLWDDDQGELELDFDADKDDIQLRGVNRDEKKIQMAKQYPNSSHFLTYRHSLRSYASILYLRLPGFFRMILRGKEIEHHNIVSDMMLKQEVTYRPQPGPDGVPKCPDMIATVTIGFVKDAKAHIAIQGFNVYHKNRLIKPFWRVWNTAGSDGRGVIGVLEANFVEPAHDKQGFEKTTVLSRLETRLVQMQKTYWSTNCHKVGYAPRRNRKLLMSKDRDSSPEDYRPSRRSTKDASPSNVSPVTKSHPKSSHKTGKVNTSLTGSVKSGNKSGHLPSRDAQIKGCKEFEKNIRYAQSRPHGTQSSSDESDDEAECTPSERFVNQSGGSKATPAQKPIHKESGHPSFSKSPRSVHNVTEGNHTLNGSIGTDHITTRSRSKVAAVPYSGNDPVIPDFILNIEQLKVENKALNERILKMEELKMLEQEKNKSLTEQLQAAKEDLEKANTEQEVLVDIFSEERNRRDKEEGNLRKKLKDASKTIQELGDKLTSMRNNHKGKH